MAKLYAAMILLSLLSVCTWGAMCATFTIRNNCGYTVWPGMLSGAGTAPLSTTGFVLASGQSSSMDVPSGWSGRFWGRTLCSTDATTGVFSCATGDCGSGTVACSGTGAVPPATLAEFTLDGSGGMDFYDVSLVDGYNLPMLVVPQGGTAGNWAAVACKSACEAFGSPQYCCSGAYGNPSTCKPSAYSEFFKNACPRAYSYAYDDATSTFTCAGANYLITFCPSTASQKSSGVNSQAAGLPLVNDTMVFLGGDSEDDTSSSAAYLAAAPRRALSFTLALLTLSLLLLKQQLF
uniref:Thaumatin-like protein 1b n=1 Tax=Ananas comosus var. bracteatus TaxID=296719 RepID=A0A6V7PI37_ANACO|nr:unnamed protein product [Ananas comosus var. bracteatus]